MPSAAKPSALRANAEGSGIASLGDSYRRIDTDFSAIEEDVRVWIESGIIRIDGQQGVGHYHLPEGERTDWHQRIEAVGEFTGDGTRRREGRCDRSDHVDEGSDGRGGVVADAVDQQPITNIVDPEIPRNQSTRRASEIRARRQECQEGGSVERCRDKCSEDDRSYYLVHGSSCRSAELIVER